MDAMKYNDLRDFLTLLEQQGELKRITLPVDPHLEITEIADRTLRAGGPALLFENPKGYSMPVLCNLFGTPKRVAMGMGQEDVSALREVGKLLAAPALSETPIIYQLNAAPKHLPAPCPSPRALAYRTGCTAPALSSL